jgi:transposase InsO family protein
MRADLVVGALEAVVAARGGDVADVIFHTDRGTRHTSGAFAAVYRRHGIRRSMGRVGSSCDNALVEPFFQGLKRS